MPSHQNQGVIFALVAYTFWAFAPIYFKLIDQVPATEILTHRVIWSLLITLIIIALTNRKAALLEALKSSKTRKYLLLTTLLIGGNWGVFIWSVNDNRMLDASLGYYINPLINIILGMLFFAERLDRPQIIAAALCVIAVGFELIQFGKVPWVALFLATSFALYGFFRKKLGVDSFVGMALETGLLLPIFAVYFLWMPHTTLNLTENSTSLNALLVLAGPVTMIPLLCFAAAANRISLSALGFFQYIGPSGMFLLAVFVYDEPFSTEKLITFSIIWSALAILIWDNILKVKHRRGAIKQI
ncbi:EamA family transporter RarD [Reinekea marina]|uniref:EamA family transporter RarD n=1 Tax=Reinekea marina TaxID=1310421 RepID=A0ABV7WUK7_9GAMM|nr:EamA family transporter RarD [Reinekea marina]MDN3650183.1 EamA family transporter RarD [Reinekea marina]